MLTQRLPRAAVAAMVVGFFGVVAGARRAVTPYTGPWRASDSELCDLPVHAECADRHHAKDEHERARLSVPGRARCVGALAA